MRQWKFLFHSNFPSKCILYHYCTHIFLMNINWKQTQSLKFHNNNNSNYQTMFEVIPWKGFFASVTYSLWVSTQALVTAADIEHVKEASINGVKLAFTLISPAAVLNRPVVIASQASAVSANLRKKEEIEQVDVEGVWVISTRLIYRCDTIRCWWSLSSGVDLLTYYSDFSMPDYCGCRSSDDWF